MIRAAIAGAFAVALTGAPLQCSRSNDPNLRREDTAGDALWTLAHDFEAKGKHEAARETLQFLVAHYPSNRHASAARAELGPDAGQ